MARLTHKNKLKQTYFYTHNSAHILFIANNKTNKTV